MQSGQARSASDDGELGNTYCGAVDAVKHTAQRGGAGSNGGPFDIGLTCDDDASVRDPFR